MVKSKTAMIRKKGNYDVNSPTSTDLGKRTKVFASVCDVSLNRKKYNLSVIMVNKPIKYKQTRIQSGEMLEIVIADIESDVATRGLIFKIYSNGESVFLPSYIVGNFIDCSSKPIGMGCMETREEIHKYAVGNAASIKIKTAGCCNYMGDNDNANILGDNKNYIPTKTGWDSKGKSCFIAEKNTTWYTDCNKLRDENAKCDGLKIANDQHHNIADLKDYPKYKVGRTRCDSINHNANYENMDTVTENMEMPVESHIPISSNNSNYSTMDEGYGTLSPPSCLVDYRSSDMKGNIDDNADYVTVNRTIPRVKELKTYTLKTENMPPKLIERRASSHDNITSLTSIADAHHNISNILKYGVVEVINLFSNLSLDYCKDNLIKLFVDGKMLASFTENDIHEKIGLSKFEARLVYYYVRGWRPLTASVTNWKQKRGMEDFSTMDLITYLGYFGYANISRYVHRYNVDGKLFKMLVQDDLLMDILFDDGSKLQRYELDDLVIRFLNERKRTYQI